MQSVVTTLTDLTAPWAGWYNDSKQLSTAVTFVHLGGLLLAGGFAIASDRATLRFGPAGSDAERALLGELHAIHRPVLIGLGLTLVSGLLMLAADVETLLPAPLFWVKMAAIAVLLGNGLLLQRAETELRRGSPAPEQAWRRLRRSARWSLALWFVTLFLGTALLSI